MFYQIENKEKIEKLLENENCKEVKDFLQKNEYTLSDIKKLKDSLPKGFPFYKILDSFTFCKPKVHVASENFKKLTEQLRIEQENKAYREMTKEVDSSQQFGKIDLMSDFGKELKEVNRQGIAIFNTIITVGGSFAFGYYGITFMYPGLNLSFEVRLIIGLLIGMDGKEAQIYDVQYPLCSSPFQWKCDSGDCIAQYDLCDGIPQCDDNSDEKYCNGRIPITTPKLPHKISTDDKMKNNVTSDIWKLSRYSFNSHVSIIGIISIIIVILFYLFICRQRQRSPSHNFRKSDLIAEDEDELLINSMYS
uniref:Low-density lipoprotein receptor domain class A n=1 Tax=Strongyloides stercoralis TaxID=6248 RepID=A0A0K0EKY0_STRER